MIGPSSAAADLVFHALAFVPVAQDAEPAARAASLAWPAYQRFAQQHMPEAAWRPFVEDAPLLSQLLRPVALAHGIGWLCELFATLAELSAAALRLPAELGDHEVASPSARAALTSLPVEPIEIVRTDLALAADAFGAAHSTLLAPFAARLAHAFRARSRSLGAVGDRVLSEPVLLSATLGPRGRLFPGRVYVGTASLPDAADVDVDAAIVLALHEASVERAGEALSTLGESSTWSHVEAVALEVGRGWVRGTPLEPAYSAWAAALDTSGLSPLSPVLTKAVERATKLDVSPGR